MFQKTDITKFPWGDLGHRPHNFLAVGAMVLIAPMESAPAYGSSSNIRGITHYVLCTGWAKK